MKLTLSDESLLPDLLTFLRSAGCVAFFEGGDIEAVRPHSFGVQETTELRAIARRWWEEHPEAPSTCPNSPVQLRPPRPSWMNRLCKPWDCGWRCHSEVLQRGRGLVCHGACPRGSSALLRCDLFCVSGFAFGIAGTSFGVPSSRLHCLRLLPVVFLGAAPLAKLVSSRRPCRSVR
jgi:hypothetical protein